MKILEFITPSNIGGAENYVVSLSKKFIEKGHEVYILSGAAENDKNPDLSVSQFLAKSGLPFKIISAGFKYDPLAILRIAYFIKKNKFDIIHTHLSKANIAGALAAKVAGIKSISTAHGFNKRTQYKYSDYVICVSNAVKENLLSQGMSGERLAVIYNGIDTEKFNPDAEGLPERKELSDTLSDNGLETETKTETETETKAETETETKAETETETKAETAGNKNIRNKAFNIGIIARLSREKGVDLFLDAAKFVLAEIPEAKFFIAGTGVLKDGLIKKAKDLGIYNSVYFLGFVGGNLVSFLKELDALVFPSLKEGLSLALLESMAMEKTVIISDAGGMPEVVEDGRNGFVVKKGDADAIYQKLVFVYNNKDIMPEIRKEARRTITVRFNIIDCADKTLNLFKSLKVL